MKKIMVSFLFIISFIFISNSVFAGRRYRYLYVSLENIPEETYYVDILVKEDPESKYYISDDKPVYNFNENAEIINYKDDDGYVSLTFNYLHEYNLKDIWIICKITTNTKPSDEVIEKYKLNDDSESYSFRYRYNSEDYNYLKSSLDDAKYEFYLALDLTYGAINEKNINKEFDKFKIAIIDKDGNILKTSNETKLKSINDYKYKYDGQKLTSHKKSNDNWGFLLVLAIILGVFGLFSFGTFVLFVLNIILYINKKDYPNYKFDGEYTPISIVLLTIILSVTGIIFLPFAFNLHVFIKLSSLKPKEEKLSVDSKAEENI